MQSIGETELTSSSSSTLNVKTETISNGVARFAAPQRTSPVVTLGQSTVNNMIIAPAENGDVRRKPEGEL